LKLWIENFATSVRILKTINYSELPEEKFLLIVLVNNTTQSHILVVLLLREEN